MRPVIRWLIRLHKWAALIIGLQVPGSRAVW